MKTLIGLILLCLCGLGWSQAPPQNRHGIGHGKSYKEASQPYVARVPYVLEWNCAEFYDLYEDGGRVKAKVKDVSVQVFDSGTGKMVASSPSGGLSGSLSVPVGGKHYVIIYSLGEWDANYIEDMDSLKKAQRAGILTKDSVITASAMAQSPGARAQSVTAAAEDEITKTKATISGKSLEDRITGIRLVASRSANVEDFGSRWAAYRNSMGW